MTFDLSVDRDIGIQVRPYLSAATRKEYARSRRPLVLTTSSWRELEDEQRAIRVSQKVSDLLHLIGKMCGTPGGHWEIRPALDYPLIAAHDASELMSYVNHLEQRGLLKLPTPPTQGRCLCEITIPGWEALEPSLAPAGIHGRCFVAMAFRPSLEDAYLRGIRPAVEDDCGLTAIRMLELEHNDKICDRIIVEVRRAQFVIADFTFHRGGVGCGYFRTTGN